jgi:hypothetical protein
MVHGLFNGNVSTVEVIFLRVRREDVYVGWGGKDLGRNCCSLSQVDIEGLVSGDGENQLNL